MTALDFDFHIDTSATAELGKVIHDPRGNAIWHWALEAGTLAQTTVEELLGKLIDPLPFALQELEAEEDGQWAGDPYNRSR